MLNLWPHMVEGEGTSIGYGGPVYECMKCRNRIPYAKLITYVSFRCPVCGFRIFRKVRSARVKHLKAR